jgi:L1 cell adhesion molecule like protein
LGSDIDNLLSEWCVQEFEKKNKGTNVKENGRAIRRLLTACERAKRSLSTSTTATIEVDGFVNGLDLNLVITRAKFESLCDVIFKRTIAPLEQVLSDAKMSKNEIHEVVMVGGSTRIPKIRELVSAFFITLVYTVEISTSLRFNRTKRPWLPKRLVNLILRSFPSKSLIAQWIWIKVK